MSRSGLVYSCLWSALAPPSSALRRLSWVVAVAAVVLALTPAPSAASSITEVEISGLHTSFTQDTANGPVSVSDAFGDAAIANFGTLGAVAADFVGSASASWRDTFTITGGTGQGMITVDWSLDGSITDHDGLAGCSVCTAPSVSFASLYPGTSTFFAASLATAGTEQVNTTGSFNVIFTYGTPFSAGFRLTANGGEPRSIANTVDFYHTGTLTNLVLPLGATLVADSGTSYPQSTAPSAVPEPSSVLLLGTGIAAWRARRPRPFPLLAVKFRAEHVRALDDGRRRE